MFNITDVEREYDSDWSLSDSDNSFENENKEHSDIPTWYTFKIWSNNQI